MNRKLAFAFLTLALTFFGHSTAAVSLAEPSSDASIKKLVSFERPSFTTTCIEIRAQYPNGVAFNKRSKNFSKKLFPKAKIDRKVYEANPHLDMNGNGIICDGGDRFRNPPNVDFKEILRGVNVRLNVYCDFLDVKIVYGTTVGYATLLFDHRCFALLWNDDPNYSLGWNAVGDIRPYVVWNFPLSDEDGVQQLAYVAPLRLDGRNFGEVKNQSQKIIQNQNTSRIFGTKGEIENLYLRIINGLVPDFFVSLELTSKTFEGSSYPSRVQCHYSMFILKRGLLGGVTEMRKEINSTDEVFDEYAFCLSYFM